MPLQNFIHKVGPVVSAVWLNAVDVLKFTIFADATTKAAARAALTLDEGFPPYYVRTAAEIAAGVTPTNYFREPGDVRRYGAVGDGSTNDSTAINNALLIGGNVWIDKPLNCRAASLTMSVADTRLRINGQLQILGSQTRLLTVTGAGCSISGHGRIVGNGSINDANSGDETTFPILVRIDAARVTISGLTFDTPEKVAIQIYNVSDCKVTNCTFLGGPSVYSASGYFAIRSTGGSRHLISGNSFIQAAGGGRTVNAIFFGGLAGGTNYCVVSNNIADSPHEKIVYLAGDYNLVSNNYVDNAPNTDPYRIIGSYNKLCSNIARACIGATQVFNGIGNEISNNLFIGCTQAGIIVSELTSAYTGGFNDTKITGNTVTGGAGTKSDGIRLYCEYGSARGVIISDNIVRNMTNLTSEGLIRVQAITPQTVDDAVIANNRLADGTNGIYVARLLRSTIEHNAISGATNYMLVEAAGSDFNRWFNNQGRSITNPSVNGLASNSRSNGNKYSDTALDGSDLVSADRGDANVTLTAGVDAPVQRFATALTANRTVTLSTTGALNGDSKFRIVRTGLGAFTLDVGGLKTIPSATAAFVDVHYDGTAWRLTGYGTL